MPSRKTGRSMNAAGRNNTSRFARLDHRILRSAAYRSLSPNDRSLLVELISLDNGNNNGSLYLSVSDAAARMGVADLSAASKSFGNLQALGFITNTVPAKFRSGGSGKSRARCWRLNWIVGPGRRAPDWAFEKFEPKPKTKERRRMERGLRALKSFKRGTDRGKFPVLESNTLDHFRPLLESNAVSESDTGTSENVGFKPMGIVRESAIHIATPWGAGDNTFMSGWWHHEAAIPATAFVLAVRAASK